MKKRSFYIFYILLILTTISNNIFAQIPSKENSYIFSETRNRSTFEKMLKMSKNIFIAKFIGEKTKWCRIENTVCTAFHFIIINEITPVNFNKYRKTDLIGKEIEIKYLGVRPGIDYFSEIIDAPQKPYPISIDSNIPRFIQGSEYVVFSDDSKPNSMILVGRYSIEGGNIKLYRENISLKDFISFLNL